MLPWYSETVWLCGLRSPRHRSTLERNAAATGDFEAHSSDISRRIRLRKAFRLDRRCPEVSSVSPGSWRRLRLAVRARQARVGIKLVLCYAFQLLASAVFQLSSSSSGAELRHESS
jgi:hypothetical protein